MKTFTHLLCVLILSIVLFACNNAHFLKEESYRNQVAQDFEQKKQELEGKASGEVINFYGMEKAWAEKAHEY